MLRKSCRSALQVAAAHVGLENFSHLRKEHSESSNAVRRKIKIPRLGRPNSPEVLSPTFSTQSEPIGNIPPAETEERYYAMLDEPDMAA